MQATDVVFIFLVVSWKRFFKSAINFVINVTQHTQNIVNSTYDQFQKLVMSSFAFVVVIVHSSLDSMCSRSQFGVATFHKLDGSCGWWLPCWTVQLFDALLGHGGPLWPRTGQDTALAHGFWLNWSCSIGCWWWLGSGRHIISQRVVWRSSMSECPGLRLKPKTRFLGPIPSHACNLNLHFSRTFKWLGPASRLLSSAQNALLWSTDDIRVSSFSYTSSDKCLEQGWSIIILVVVMTRLPICPFLLNFSSPGV